MLATRLERLNTLVELATPLAERTSTRIEQANRALEAGLMQTGDRSAETFHQFWNLDRGIFDTARELAHAHASAHASATDGAELTEHAVNASTRTAAHTRDMQRLPRYYPTQPRQLREPGHTGTARSHARAGRPSHLANPPRKTHPPPCHHRTAAAPAAHQRGGHPPAARHDASPPATG